MFEVTRFSCRIKWSLDPADVPLLEIIANVDEFLRMGSVFLDTHESKDYYKGCLALFVIINGYMHTMITTPYGKALWVQVNKRLRSNVSHRSSRCMLSPLTE